MCVELIRYGSHQLNQPNLPTLNHFLRWTNGCRLSHVPLFSFPTWNWNRIQFLKQFNYFALNQHRIIVSLWMRWTDRLAKYIENTFPNWIALSYMVYLYPFCVIKEKKSTPIWWWIFIVVGGGGNDRPIHAHTHTHTRHNNRVETTVSRKIFDENNWRNNWAYCQLDSVCLLCTIQHQYAAAPPRHEPIFIRLKWNHLNSYNWIGCAWCRKLDLC